MKRPVWRTLFLGLTAVVLGMEIYASVSDADELDPWTHMIVDYIPREVTALAIAGLSGWLAVHFYRHYRAKDAGKRSPDA